MEISYEDEPFKIEESEENGLARLETNRLTPGSFKNIFSSELEGKKLKVETFESFREQPKSEAEEELDLSGLMEILSEPVKKLELRVKNHENLAGVKFSGTVTEMLLEEPEEYRKAITSMLVEDELSNYKTAEAEKAKEKIKKALEQGGKVKEQFGREGKEFLVEAGGGEEQVRF